MDVPLPWERVLWSDRSRSLGGEQYVLTDFRLVCVNGPRSAEIALYDIRHVHSVRSKLDRLLGTTTLVIHGRRGQELVVRRIRFGIPLQGILEILAADPQQSIDAEAVRAALRGNVPDSPQNLRQPLLLFAAVVVAVFSVAIGVHGKPAGVVYPEDDAIYPGGKKRDRESIARFMETTVLPWAKQALAPIVGGSDLVTCGTCHGIEPDTKAWSMPAVGVLPQPAVADRGWERYGNHMDAQMRNAIYGYLAESDNQSKAAYMREVVMPGMARLLGRPAYDFTRTYEYNRTHFAFGCYHCHRVE